MSIRVAAVACERYDARRVHDAVQRALALLGGIEHFVESGDHVLVRPNLIGPHPIAAAATTHPAVVGAVVQAAQAAGGQVTIGDCPGGLTGRSDLSHSYRISGMADVARATGAELDYDLRPVEVEHAAGHYLKRAALVRSVVESDVIITVPKLKTHALTGLTGAVKLCFGAVPGRAKTGYHLRYPKVSHLSGALLDLHDLVGPKLTVMDAVVGMEGDGPTGGDPRHIGAILASEDSVACDLAAAKLVSMDPREVSTLRVADEQGRPGARLANVELTGDGLAQLRVEAFRLPGSRLITRSALFDWAVDHVGRWVSPHPVPAAHCTGCGTCAENCPLRAITMAEDRPHIDYGECIHCFCCQELCPVHAMDIRYPRLTRWWTRSG